MNPHDWIGSLTVGMILALVALLAAMLLSDEDPPPPPSFS
jgi:hypothetical protein